MKIKSENKIELYSSEEVFKKASRSPAFKKAYTEERARLELIRQIRQTRLLKKLSQKDVAQKAGMPQSVIARLESGRHPFSMSTLYRIANVFGKKIVLA